MRAYLIRRSLFAVVLIFLSTVIAFAVIKFSPGRPLIDVNPRLSREYIEEQARLFGLNRSPTAQYLSWLGVLRLLGKDKHGGLLQGDLGLSIKYNQPVWAVIKSRLLATLVLNLVTVVFTWTIAIPLGIWAAVHQYRWPDKVLSALGFTGMSLPSFFMALVMLWFFASRHQILPPGGLASLDHDQMNFSHRMLDYGAHLVIPVIVLTFGALASLQRYARGSMLEVLREQYITTARAKGLSESRVIYKHALRNAVNPLITMLGYEFAGLFGGAALLENVINFPGIGQLMLQSLFAKDQAVIMAVFLIGSVMLVIGNLLADILLAWVDPRVSYA